MLETVELTTTLEVCSRRVVLSMSCRDIPALLWPKQELTTAATTAE